MIDVLDIDYGELEDAAGWAVEAPWLVDGTERPTGEQVLEAMMKLLHVDSTGLWQFVGATVAPSLNDCGLGIDELTTLLGKREREFFVLLGIAAARGKCPGP